MTKNLNTVMAGCAMMLTALILISGCKNEDSILTPTGAQPGVAGISPDSGSAGTQVTITGSSFDSSATVAFGRWKSPQVTVVSATTILAYAPDSVRRDSLYAVQVTNSGGKYAVGPHPYKGVSPWLRDVNGVSKPSGNTGSTVILEGRFFGDLVGKGTVYFSDASGAPVPASVTLPGDWTDQFIVTTVPSGAASGPVWVQTLTGRSDSVQFVITQSSTFSPSVINWTKTTSLPDSSQGHQAVFLPVQNGSNSQNVVYLTGGANGLLNPKTLAAHATVTGNGQLGAWVTATGLPEARAFHGSVVATPYNALIDTNVAGHLYVIGGIDTSGTPTSTVFKATVNLDLSLSSWEQVATLSVPLHSMGVAIFRSWLYVVGGATAGNVPVSNVWRAHIETDGSLGPWEPQPALDYPCAYAPLVQFAGVFYIVGGDTGTVAPGVNTLTASRIGAISYNALDLRTAVLKSPHWTLNGPQLIKPAAKHSAVVAGGTILVSGGIYQGDINSSTEHQYASINLDGSVGSFNGATGSHTIAGAGGAGGVPFFNHAAISYVDASGVAHVVILGGNNVINPLHPVPNTYYY